MVDTPIGTNSPNYTLVSGDLGATIYCRVTATNVSGSSNAISNVVGPITGGVPPANAGGANLPNIADTTPEVSVAVSCTTGTWTGDPTILYSYQWKRGGTNVGTDSSSYTPVVGDLGATLQCVVTATNGAGSSPANSNTTGAVAAAPAGGSAWNPADAFNVADAAFSNSNRTIDLATPGTVSCRGTQSRSTGKLYFEITVGAYTVGDTTDKLDIGIASAAHTLSVDTPGDVDSNGFTYHGDAAYVSTMTGAGFYNLPGLIAATGYVYGFACDLDSHDGWISRNGTWMQGDPVAATSPFDWGDTAGAAMFPWTHILEVLLPVQVTITTVAPFANTPPTGYSAWG